MVSVTPYGGDPEEAGRQEDLIWNWPPGHGEAGWGRGCLRTGSGYGSVEQGGRQHRDLGPGRGEEKLLVTEQRKDPASSLH